MQVVEIVRQYDDVCISGVSNADRSAALIQASSTSSLHLPESPHPRLRGLLMSVKLLHLASIFSIVNANDPPLFPRKTTSFQL